MHQFLVAYLCTITYVNNSSMYIHSDSLVNRCLLIVAPYFFMISSYLFCLKGECVCNTSDFSW